MKEPRVIEVLKHYKHGDIKEVYEYLSHSDMQVDDDTWSGQIKKMIENEEILSAKTLIEITLYFFENTNK